VLVCGGLVLCGGFCGVGGGGGGGGVVGGGVCWVGFLFVGFFGVFCGVGGGGGGGLGVLVWLLLLFFWGFGVGGGVGFGVEKENVKDGPKLDRSRMAGRREKERSEKTTTEGGEEARNKPTVNKEKGS